MAKQSWIASKLEDLGYWYGFIVDAVDHINRGHNVIWRHDVDLWLGLTGYTLCVECPDTSVEDGKHVGLVLWCRWNRVVGWFGRIACGIVGHPVFQHPKQGERYIETEIYCYRCMAESTLRKVWLDVDRPEASQGEPAA